MSGEWLKIIYIFSDFYKKDIYNQGVVLKYYWDIWTFIKRVPCSLWEDHNREVTSFLK